MTPYQQGQVLANTGGKRPGAGSDTKSQQKQKGYDDQQAKNNGGK